MKKKLIFVFFTFISTNILCQNKTVIDEQVLTNGKLIRLTSFYSNDENKHYAIELINRFSDDTIVNYIDSIQHAHCSPPNSILFVNDSTGFFTESGGCYASYDWLFRTTDRGKTWKHIKTGSRTYGNPALCRLNSSTFYMFTELKGIIIWDFKEGKLTYSLTSDGGINWKTNSQDIVVNTRINEIHNITYSADGQVTLECGEKYIVEGDRKKVTIIQSNNFGNSFNELK
ncbi:MAG: WD40/YVTN/BNR-like repeat-containing protein [Bacteroidota bacterium]|jgi:hypothetical protein